MRLKTLPALLTSVGLVVAGLTAAPPAGAVSSLTNPPAGANDWSCRPSAAHPRPVVLVHGLSANMNLNWSYLAPRLKARGYCVYALTYGLNPSTAPLGAPGGVIRIQDSARELSVFVDRVRRATGARKVDLVGHSEGTFMPQYYLKFLGGAAKVRRYVAYTPLYRGTEVAGVSMLRDLGSAFGVSDTLISVVSRVCGSCPQFLKGSRMQRRLAAGGAAVPGVEYTTVMTRYDELVVPYTSGFLAGQRNFVLQDLCPGNLAEHAAVAADPVTAQITFNALAPRRARPIRC